MSSEESGEVPRRMRRFYRGQAEKAEARQRPVEKTAGKKEIPKKEEPIRPTREMEQLLKEIGRKEEEELIETLYEEEKGKEPERAVGKFRGRKAEKPEREAAEENYRVSREIPEEMEKEEEKALKKFFRGDKIKIPRRKAGSRKKARKGKGKGQ